VNNNEMNQKKKEEKEGRKEEEKEVSRSFLFIFRISSFLLIFLLLSSSLLLNPFLPATIFSFLQSLFFLFNSRNFQKLPKNTLPSFSSKGSACALSLGPS